MVCDEYDNGVWDVCLVKPMCACVYVNCVDASIMSSVPLTVRSGGLSWPKPAAMALLMPYRDVLAVTAFEAMLCVYVWDVACDVWE